MSNAKGGDGDSPRKHSGAVGFGHAKLPTLTLISRRVCVYLWRRLRLGSGRRPLPVQQEIFGRISPSPKNLIFPFRFQQKCRIYPYPSFSLDGTKLQARGSGEFELAGNHSGSSVLSADPHEQVARFRLIKHSIECSSLVLFREIRQILILRWTWAVFVCPSLQLPLVPHERRRSDVGARAISWLFIPSR